MSQAPNITLYTAQTPNGIKISMLLEELGLPYTAKKIDMKANEQKQQWFLDINPNGRIPAITDSHPTEPAKIVRVFESGSIMQYLVDRYDKDHQCSFPRGTVEHIEMTSWLFFLNAGVGPMQGQANHFTRYAPEQIQYGIDRYQNETKRLYGVLDEHLSKVGGDYLVGNKCTIADIAHWGWIAAGLWAGVDISVFPHLKAWEERMWARPATKKGADVPDPYKMKEILKDPAEVQRIMNSGRDMIQAGMKADKEKNEQRTASKV
ncbi:Glutathione S-transferase-like protein 9 [Elsinoe fawcettii]|nr:Glutathione S-transferase-like protein 9 [Elsinoe fawcettii]